MLFPIPCKDVETLGRGEQGRTNGTRDPQARYEFNASEARHRLNLPTSREHPPACVQTISADNYLVIRLISVAINTNCTGTWYTFPL